MLLLNLPNTLQASYAQSNLVLIDVKDMNNPVYLYSISKQISILFDNMYNNSYNFDTNVQNISAIISHFIESYSNLPESEIVDVNAKNAIDNILSNMKTIQELVKTIQENKKYMVDNFSPYISINNANRNVEIFQTTKDNVPLKVIPRQSLYNISHQIENLMNLFSSSEYIENQKICEYIFINILQIKEAQLKIIQLLNQNKNTIKEDLYNNICADFQRLAELNQIIMNFLITFSNVFLCKKAGDVFFQNELTNERMNELFEMLESMEFLRDDIRNIQVFFNNIFLQYQNSEVISYDLAENVKNFLRRYADLFGCFQYIKNIYTISSVIYDIFVGNFIPESDPTYHSFIILYRYIQELFFEFDKLKTLLDNDLKLTNEMMENKESTKKYFVSNLKIDEILMCISNINAYTAQTIATMSIDDSQEAIKQNIYEEVGKLSLSKEDLYFDEYGSNLPSKQPQIIKQEEKTRRYSGKIGVSIVSMGTAVVVLTILVMLTLISVEAAKSFYQILTAAFLLHVLMDIFLFNLAVCENVDSSSDNTILISGIILLALTFIADGVVAFLKRSEYRKQESFSKAFLLINNSTSFAFISLFATSFWGLSMGMKHVILASSLVGMLIFQFFITHYLFSSMVQSVNVQIPDATLVLTN